MKSGASLPYWPRVLRREQAAAYLGLGTSTFDVEVSAGRMPAPVPVTQGIRGWDRHDLDLWIEDRKAVSGASCATVANPWDDAG